MSRRNNRADRREQATFSASFDWPPLAAAVNPAPPEQPSVTEPDDPVPPQPEAAVRRYADPGYQPDGKKRYPIDTPQLCSAAWGYINMPDRAERYTFEQHQIIKGRIQRAMKRMGLEPKPIEFKLPPGCLSAR